MSITTPKSGLGKNKFHQELSLIPDLKNAFRVSIRLLSIDKATLNSGEV